MRDFKEVDFEKYCPKCKYGPRDEKYDPCNECLEYGALECTERPFLFEKKED